MTGELSFGFFARYEAELGNGMHENEFVYVYFGRLQAEPKPDPAEIADVAHWSFDDISRRIQRDPEFVYVLVQALFSEPWRRDRATGETHRGTLARLIRVRAGHSEHSFDFFLSLDPALRAALTACGGGITFGNVSWKICPFPLEQGPTTVHRGGSI